MCVCVSRETRLLKLRAQIYGIENACLRGSDARVPLKNNINFGKRFNHFLHDFKTYSSGVGGGGGGVICCPIECLTIKKKKRELHCWLYTIVVDGRVGWY